ncbi:hypothetical protein SAMN06265338_11722 [Rhodoblastus acidophilus]|uniref:Uncharacterized protein n=1 Tax=Rhodoblastus acidophilus TaxID=1074 RepID=A0A212S9L6_RHOAC|nr:hypothetical protein CH337_09865 [Rhodoblastus acidophilus]SNB81927.1 hypothetical protein SAMN06265338_11722 [Rhodoblastus acidophilus]
MGGSALFSVSRRLRAFARRPADDENERAAQVDHGPKRLNGDHHAQPFQASGRTRAAPRRNSAAQAKAIIAIGASVKRQALIMAFSDAFALIGVILLIAAVALLFASKMKPAAGGSGGGH